MYTYGKEPFGSLKVDCHDFDMILYLGYMSMFLCPGWLMASAPSRVPENPCALWKVGHRVRGSLPVDPCSSVVGPT